MSEFLYGRWPVLESLRANRRHFEQLLLLETVEEKGPILEIISTAEARGVGIRRVPRRVIDDLAKGANHQGVVLRCGPYPYATLRDLLDTSVLRHERNFFLALDLLQDPQNVGSLLRIADAVGLHGVILQERRGVGVTEAVVSASSGAVEHLLVAQVGNLVSALKELKDNDVWIVGLDIGPNIQPLDRVDLNINLCFVLGGEGDGMRRLVRDTCDLLVTLPMRGHVESLNVATAGSIALYAAWQARGWQGWALAEQK
ncbi:MAG: 23S rRNA (guanosine(2251)-2'-O)-methyltransferase RlmB [Anaerolineae bacterium]|nr:23S rRNA (guanosine(2251)-2'-O)-methyltransferase RlmB [Anaerolineae bacterium]